MDESAVNLTEKVAANERSMANLRPHQFKPGESGNPRGGRRKGALALVKSVIGDAREQLAMLERISRGEGIVLTYSDRKGRKRRKLLWPTLTDARKCAIYLVERRWGKLPAYSPSDATAEPITGFDGAQLPDGLRLKLREVARELVLEYAPPDAHRIPNPGGDVYTQAISDTCEDGGPERDVTEAERSPALAGAEGVGAAQGGAPASASAGPSTHPQAESLSSPEPETFSPVVEGEFFSRDVVEVDREPRVSLPTADDLLSQHFRELAAQRVESGSSSTLTGPEEAESPAARIPGLE